VPTELHVKPINNDNPNVHHHHVQEGLGLIPVPCILKMKLVPPSLPPITEDGHKQDT